MVGGGVTSVGIIQAIGDQTYQRRKQKAITQKGGCPPQTWSNLRGYPGGREFAKSGRATKINERSVAKKMPLMGEFT